MGTPLLVAFLLLALFVPTAALADEGPAEAKDSVAPVAAEPTESRAAAPTANASGGASATAQEQSLADMLAKRFGTLSITGNLIGYYQGSNSPTIAGEKVPDADGFGVAGDLEFGFEPVENGNVTVRLHFGEGTGADGDLADRLLANLNTIADDNPGSDRVTVLDAFYAHTLLDGALEVAVGKTEPFRYLDDNAFANDEYTQFVGKPFVNDPVWDSENEYSPLLALTYKPAEMLSLAVVAQSSSRPLLDEELQKDGFDDVFDSPFLGGQIALSPNLLDLDGTYRVTGWTQTYDHPFVDGSDESGMGWGVGFNADQYVAQQLGLFARFGYYDADVYQARYSWSVGAQVEKFLESRPDDTIGLAVGGLKGNPDADPVGEAHELHLEAYYRFAFGDHFAITPDIQYIINPLADRDNDGVVAGMLRLVASF